MNTGVHTSIGGGGPELDHVRALLETVRRILQRRGIWISTASIRITEIPIVGSKRLSVRGTGRSGELNDARRRKTARCIVGKIHGGLVINGYGTCNGIRDASSTRFGYVLDDVGAGSRIGIGYGWSVRNGLGDAVPKIPIPGIDRNTGAGSIGNREGSAYTKLIGCDLEFGRWTIIHGDLLQGVGRATIGGHNRKPNIVDAGRKSSDL